MIREGKSTQLAADRYDAHSALEQEVAARLLERVEYIRNPPARIIDLGCGTGQASAELKNRFRKAQVIGIDRSMDMLRRLRKRSGFLRPVRALCADMSSLPLPDYCADLLFSNMAIQWCGDLEVMFSEFRRVLRPGGMLLFTCPGPDSLRELRSAWPAGQDKGEPGFVDMHELGDALLAAGFHEPVTDCETIELQYSSLDSLMDELECTGAADFIDGWSRTATVMADLRQAFAPGLADRKYPLTYEIIYGTAFGPAEGQPRKTPQGDVATFSVESLRSSRLPGRR